MKNRFQFHTVARGFLPANEPISELLELSLLAKELNKLAQNIPTLIREKKLRQHIDLLNKQYSDHLIHVSANTPRFVDGSLLVFLMLAQAYIFEDPAHPAKELPAVLSENILHLSKMMKRLPVITYTDYVLNNWRLIDKFSPISLDNIEPLFTFTGSEDEKWFIKIHVAIEAACHDAIIAAKKSLNISLSVEKSQQLYESIANSLNEARTILLRMKEQCRSDYFYHILRPYLSGWETVKTQVEEKEESGIRFQRAITLNDREPLRCYRGMSGAQSGIIPAFDAFLGIKQDSDPMHKMLQEFQAYMRPEDRALISSLEANNIPGQLQQAGDDRLVKTLENCMRQQALFRTGHLSIVHQFVYLPAKKQGISSDVIKGTGGTPTEEYLGKRTVATQQAADKMRARL